MTEYGSRWRRIYSNEWHDAAFQGLSDTERQVYCYARTGPQSTSVGIYRVSTALAVEDMGKVAGVAPPGFVGAMHLVAADLWLPAAMYPDLAGSAGPPRSPCLASWVAWRPV